MDSDLLLGFGWTSNVSRRTQRRQCRVNSRLSSPAQLPRYTSNWPRMASGYGMHGGKCTTWCRQSPNDHDHNACMALWLTSGPRRPGVGRCFPFWQDVMACYVVNTSAEDDSGKKKCSPVLEDYYECLHHKKEVGSASIWDLSALSLQSATMLTRSSTHEHWLYRPPTPERRLLPPEITHRARSKYGIWDCWTRRTIPRRCWDRAKA